MPLPLAGAYPAIESLILRLDDYLKRVHPQFFGPTAYHPKLPVKRSKVVHDNLWGTNRFSWRELTIIDSPIFQRLRDIHQVGLAFQVYPSAHHMRFDHSLGVTTIASRVFDAIATRHRGKLRDIAGNLYPTPPREDTIAKFRQELRLAALLHDTGHSLFSHASERVFEDLTVLKNAADELKTITAKRKGAGEALSFCMALTPSVKELLDRSKNRLTGETTSEDYEGDIDLTNVALLIVGRSTHPALRWMGEIISSGFDADKLDYLLRDAKAAGLPLTYDLDRYLYAVLLAEERLADGDGLLERLYGSVAPVKPPKEPAPSADAEPYYDSQRIRLPRQAMNAIEQIVICKLMLYSYIYHHPKVRSGEGMLTLMLQRQVEQWRKAGDDDGTIVEKFLSMTDSSLRSETFANATDPIVKEYAYRIANRLLPREVLSLSVANASGTDKVLVGAFIEGLQEGGLPEFEKRLATEIRAVTSLTGSDDEVLRRAGVWVDIPKPPKFEDVDKMIIAGKDVAAGVQLTHLFPIRQWTDAYTHYRYSVRLFAFSEYYSEIGIAAKKTIMAVGHIENEDFYKRIMRKR